MRNGPKAEKLNKKKQQHTHEKKSTGYNVFQRKCKRSDRFISLSSINETIIIYQLGYFLCDPLMFPLSTIYINTHVCERKFEEKKPRIDNQRFKNFIQH